jgi:hypothetical protein
LLRLVDASGCQTNIFQATGNFADFGVSQAILRPIDEHIQIVAAKFPKQQNRDFFSQEQGKATLKQGI